jgi:hypothetical protein
VDHGVAVLLFGGVVEVLVGFLVVCLHQVGDSIEVDRPQVHHRIRVAQLGRLQVATHC